VSGDPDAFEALYRQHAARIYSLACRMTGSTAEGEDLVQEIFLQAYQKLDSFKGDAAIGTWLYRLAINRCLDFTRSRRARMDRLTGALGGPSGDAPAAREARVKPNPDVGLDLERAIGELPDGYREVFVLHDVEGFEHSEIATMLGIAEGTSRSQAFKARLRLRALLNGHVR
jgi:RNA polymerase sigma-70 factor (ECF subfamily)